MTFSDALYKAKAAAEAEKVREGDAPCARAMMAPQPRKMVEDEEEVVELCMPRSLGFVDHGGGGAHETPGVGIVDPFDVVGVFGNLWWRMVRRFSCGQGHPALHISRPLRPSILSTHSVTPVRCSLAF